MGHGEVMESEQKRGIRSLAEVAQTYGGVGENRKRDKGGVHGKG